jgi:hypothetical protein
MIEATLFFVFCFCLLKKGENFYFVVLRVIFFSLKIKYFHQLNSRSFAATLASLRITRREDRYYNPVQDNQDLSRSEEAERTEEGFRVGESFTDIAALPTSTSECDDRPQQEDRSIYSLHRILK